MFFLFQCKSNSCQTNDTLESIPVSFLFPSTPTQTMFALPKYNADPTKVTTGYFSNALPQISSSPPHQCQYLPGSRRAVIQHMMHSVAEPMFFPPEGPEEKTALSRHGDVLQKKKNGNKKTAISTSPLSKLTSARTPSPACPP